MKNVFLSLSLLLLSCNSEQSNFHFVDISLDTWILENQEIKSLLSDFIHSTEEYSNRKNSFIVMWYSVKNDSTYSYVISESHDICSFIYPAPHTIFKYENRLICCRIYELDIFRINDEFLVKFMKKNYPDQYAYYLKVGNYPPPITGGGPGWVLTFQNDCLISKEVYNMQ